MFAKNDCALFFWNDTILTQKQDLNYVIAFEDTNLDLTKNDYYFLGNFDNRNIYTVNLNLPSIENQSNHLFMPARDLLKTVDLQAAKLILRGKQLLNWHRSFS